MGSSVFRDFINNGLTQGGIPVANFQRPAGLVDANPCQPPDGQPASVDASEVELYLPGTESQCPKPTASPPVSRSLFPSIPPVAAPAGRYSPLDAV